MKDEEGEAEEVGGGGWKGRGRGRGDGSGEHAHLFYFLFCWGSCMSKYSPNSLCCIGFLREEKRQRAPD